MTVSERSIHTIRTLSMDAVQEANSGHPGTPMALAPLAYELWMNHLRYNPRNPGWLTGTVSYSHVVMPPCFFMLFSI